MSKNKKKTNKKSIKNNKNFRLVCLIFSIVFCFFSLLFDFFLIYADILPLKFFIPLIVILSLFEYFLVFVILKKKFRLWLKYLAMFFSVLFSFLFLIGCIYIFKAYDFMGKIRSKNIMTEEYYVMVKKNSKIESIIELKDKTIATFDEKVDIYNDAVDKLKQTGNYELKQSDSVAGMIDELLNDEVDAIMISEFHKQQMDEETPEFSEKTKIIYTINVEVKTSETKDKPAVSVTKDTFTIYISGIDTYGSISKRSRSDVNMLVTINPSTHQILLTSIPRDYYVQLHDTTGYKDKLTHAGVYGIDMSVSTLEDLLNINIDYYVRVNFSTLINVVDTIGGIDVYSDKGFTPWTNKAIYIPQGTVHMDGAMALAFARERKTYLEGDRHRVKNQQDVITAIIKKVTSSTTLLTKYTSLLDQLSSSFETNIDTKALTNLIKMQLDKMPSWDIQMYSLNGSDAMEYTYSYGNQKLYVMIPYQETIDKVQKYITDMENGEKITVSDEDKFVAADSSHINATSTVVSSNIEDDENEEIEDEEQVVDETSDDENTLDASSDEEETSEDEVLPSNDADVTYEQIDDNTSSDDTPNTEDEDEISEEEPIYNQEEA